MKSLTLSDYTDYSRFLPPLHQLEAQLSRHHVIFLRDKNEFVEKKLAPPSFCEFNYEYLMMHGRPVPFEEAWKHYQEKHKSWFKTKAAHLDKDDLRGLEARLLRAYASLMRDFHMAAMLKHVAKSAQVFVSPELDTRHDIDVLVIYEGVNFGLNLRTQTKRSLEFRAAKAHRHNRFDDVVYLDVPLDLGSGKKCGGYLLYTPNHIDYIKNKTRQTVKDLKTHVVNPNDRDACAR